MEFWRQIENYEGLYDISNYGQVYSYKRKILLKHTIRKYDIVGLIKDGKKKQYKVHRLVALAFINNPNEYPEIDHIDRNKQNNYVDNLKWCNRSMNMLNVSTRIDNKLKEKYIRKTRNRYEVRCRRLNIRKGFKTLEEAKKYRNTFLSV